MAQKRISPWAHIADKLRAEAQELAEDDNRLGMLFREVQQEAYKEWAIWDEALDTEVEAESKTANPQEVPQEVTLRPSIVDRGKEVIRRLLPVEPWAVVARVALASSAPASGNVRPRGIYSEELSLLRIQPYIRVDVQKSPKGPTVRFMLEPLTHPEHPGRLLDPKGGIVEVRLIRPAPKQEIIATLGGNNPKQFDFLSTQLLRDYSAGEEKQWTEAEISIRPK